MGCFDDLFGSSDDSKTPWHRDHPFCVNKVRKHLLETCDKARKEALLHPRRRTDVYGFNSKENTWYICEIKVRWADLQKFEFQLQDTCQYLAWQYPTATVLPILAIPVNLHDELITYGNWAQVESRCETGNIKIWLIPYRGPIKKLG